MNLILCEPREVRDDGSAILTGSRAAHVRDVLRASVGDEVRVGIMDGPHGQATIIAIDSAADRIELRARFDQPAPPIPAVDLLLALPRPKVLRRLWAQLAALGVGRIILTNAARVERHYFDTHILDETTYRPLLIEGLQQARDTRLPRVSIHRQFRPLVEDQLADLSDATARLVADPGAAKPLSEVLREPRPHVAETDARIERRVLLAVGPEGGWNAFELDLLFGRGFQPVAIGPRVLRTDTACIALLALVHDALQA